MIGNEYTIYQIFASGQMEQQGLGLLYYLKQLRNWTNYTLPEFLRQGTSGVV